MYDTLSKNKVPKDKKQINANFKMKNINLYCNELNICNYKIIKKISLKYSILVDKYKYFLGLKNIFHI